MVRQQPRSAEWARRRAKRMLRRDRHANALAKQLLKPHIVQRTSLWGTELSIRVEAGHRVRRREWFCCSNRASDVHLWHRSLKSRKVFGRISANGVGE